MRKRDIACRNNNRTYVRICQALFFVNEEHQLISSYHIVHKCERLERDRASVRAYRAPVGDRACIFARGTICAGAMARQRGCGVAHGRPWPGPRTHLVEDGPRGHGA